MALRFCDFIFQFYLRVQKTERTNHDSYGKESWDTLRVPLALHPSSTMYESVEVEFSNMICTDVRHTRTPQSCPSSLWDPY